MKTRTRQDVAFERKVTPARITQIAGELGIVAAARDSAGRVHYWVSDVKRILKFETKPGPKGKKGPRKTGARKQ